MRTAARRNWRAYAVLGGLCGASFFVEDALQSWSAVHLTQTFHVGAGVAGAAPTAFGLAAGTSRTFLHVAGARRASATLVRAGGTLATVGILLAGLAPDAVLAVIGVLLGGAGIAVCAPVLVGIAGRVGGVRAIAAVGAAGYIGFVVAPPAVGGIAQASNLRVAFVSLAVLSTGIAALARQVDR